MRRVDRRRGRYALGVLAIFTACGGDSGPTEAPVATAIAISPSSGDLSSLGETLQLTATVLDQAGQAIAGALVNWASHDNSVATVSSSGLVTAVQNGSAAVTATSGGASGTAAVTIAQRTARIDISPSADTLFALGDTVRLTSSPVDANGNNVPDVTIAWSSGDEAVATVDAKGLVTATGNGRATITATAAGTSGTAALTVSQLAVGMDVVPAAATLFSLRDTLRLVAVGVDANGNAILGLTFDWTSNNDAVVVVDSNGLVMAIRTGSTDVFAVAGELRDSAGVTVAQLAVEVRVTPAVDTLDAVGDTVRLSAMAVDRNGHEVEDTDYIWFAPHPSVVTVNRDGLVTAKGPGTAEIRVKANRAGANYIGIATITVGASTGGRGTAGLRPNG